ncbi:MAG: hypothetical protein RIT27_550 [Pseudomonadota bacterium]
MAEKLGIAVGSYAKIERGETDVHTSRLVQIAKTMEVDLSQLLELSGKNFVKVLENSTNYGKYIGNHNIFLTETECAHELEKALLTQQSLEKENELLRKQVSQLEEINRLKENK